MHSMHRVVNGIDNICAYGIVRNKYEANYFHRRFRLFQAKNNSDEVIADEFFIIYKVSH